MRGILRGIREGAPLSLGKFCLLRPVAALHIYLLVVYVLSGTGGRASPLFPLPECDMRHSVKKPRSVGAFKRRAGKTHQVNVRRNLRGGIRL